MNLSSTGKRIGSEMTPLTKLTVNGNSEYTNTPSKSVARISKFSRKADETLLSARLALASPKLIRFPRWERNVYEETPEKLWSPSFVRRGRGSQNAPMAETIVDGSSTHQHRRSARSSTKNPKVPLHMKYLYMRGKIFVIQVVENQKSGRVIEQSLLKIPKLKIFRIADALRAERVI
jgi:hypothetical protein